MMEKKQLINIVEDEFYRSLGAPGGSIATERAAAMDFYLSKPWVMKLMVSQRL